MVIANPPAPLVGQGVVAVPTGGQRLGREQRRSATRKAPAAEEPSRDEPEILEGLARDIVSRLATTLFAEDETSSWAGATAGEEDGPSQPARAGAAGSREREEAEPREWTRSSEGDSAGPGATARPSERTPPALQAGAGRKERDGSHEGSHDESGGRGGDSFAAVARAPRRVRPPGGDRLALLVRGTVRSGRQVRHNGDVVVLGDVNPGGQIVAAGDVAVMGALRGMVHAGATGDHSAVVAAFRLRPTQLRIASYVSRPPEEPGVHPEYPELALVRDGIVVLQPLTTGALTRSGPDDPPPPRRTPNENG